MGWHELIGIVAGVIQVLAIIPYLRDVVRGSARPNIVSWSLWTLAVLISTVAQINAGASWSLIILITATVLNVSVVFVGALGYGYKKFGWVEGICLFFSLFGILLWQITSNPVLAISFAVAADCIAYIPTIVKTYRDPHSETALLWFVLFIVGSLGAISTTKIDAANLVFPIYYATINLLLWILVVGGQKLSRAAH